jgi:hypothetical protein
LIVGYSCCYRYLTRAGERRSCDLKNISGGSLVETEDAYWLHLSRFREALPCPNEGRLEWEEAMASPEAEMAAERAQMPCLVVWPDLKAA